MSQENALACSTARRCTHADAAQRLHWCWRAASRSAASCVSSPGRRRRRRRLRDEGRLRSRRWLRFACQRRFAATGITAHSSASAPPLLPKSSSAPRRKRAGPRCSERNICERGHAAAERAAQLHVAGTTWLLSPLPSASEHSVLVELFAATTYQSRNGPFHGDLASVFVLEEVSACFLKVRPVV